MLELLQRLPRLLVGRGVVDDDDFERLLLSNRMHGFRHQHAVVGTGADDRQPSRRGPMIARSRRTCTAKATGYAASWRVALAGAQSVAASATRRSTRLRSGNPHG
jgi:hypothetical protein